LSLQGAGIVLGDELKFWLSQFEIQSQQTLRVFGI